MSGGRFLQMAHYLCIEGEKMLPGEGEPHQSEIKSRIENMTKEILTIVNSASQRCNDYSDNKNKMLENDIK